MNIFKIFLDLDGVIVDLNKGVQETCPEVFEIHKTDREKAHQMLEDLPSSFWARLDWTTDGLDLWRYVKPFYPTILSAHMDNNKESCINGKRIWIIKKLGLQYMRNSVICLREEKKNYSGKNKILIDDSELNIEEWINTGGIGIHHTSTKKTIEKLKEIENGF